MGKGNYQGGIFNLFVSFDYNATKYLPEWKNGFNRASNLLLQATGCKMKFGTITAANRGCSFTKGVDPGQEADIVISGPAFNGNRLSCLVDSCNCPPTWPYQNPCLGWAWKYFTLLHDDRLQEWIIIHEFSHYAFGLYDENKNQLGQPGGSCCNLQNKSKCIMEVWSPTVNQYCDVDDHTPNNEQQTKNQQSCWATIREKYPDILLRPVLPASDINWVVI